MHVSQILLKNFKRFHDLTVSDIPETAKLVLIVGPNGCGKSSVFDALHHWARLNTGLGVNGDEKYFKKSQENAFNWHDSVTVNFHGNSKPHKGCLYLRTAYRNDPDFSTNNFQRPGIPTDEVRVQRLIENDATVSQNYQRLVYDSLNALFAEGNPSAHQYPR